MVSVQNTLEIIHIGFLETLISLWIEKFFELFNKLAFPHFRFLLFLFVCALWIEKIIYLILERILLCNFETWFFHNFSNISIQFLLSLFLLVWGQMRNNSIVFRTWITLIFRSWLIIITHFKLPFFTEGHSSRKSWILKCSFTRFLCAFQPALEINFNWLFPIFFVQ